MTKLDPNHVAWFKNVFDITEDGGTFIIPRTGLFFKKVGDSMVLVKLSPYKPGCGNSEKEWAESQMGEFNMASLHFGAAGVPVSIELK